MKIDNFNVDIIVEHGCPHYKIVNMYTGSEIHCDLNELNQIILEMENITHLSYDK